MPFDLVQELLSPLSHKLRVGLFHLVLFELLLELLESLHLLFMEGVELFEAIIEVIIVVLWSFSQSLRLE